MGKLPRLRKKIDAIDDRLLELLNQRADVVLEVGKVKQRENLDLHSPLREREILQRLEKANPGLKVDMILTYASEATRAAKQATRSIPIVFVWKF